MKKIAKKYKNIGEKVFDENVTITVFDQKRAVLSFKKQDIAIPITKKDIKELFLVSSAVRKGMNIKITQEDIEMIIDELE